MTDSPGEFEPTRPRRSLLRRSAIVTLLVVSCALAVAACGGGSPNSASSATTGAGSSGGSSSSGPSNSLVQQTLKYAQCMRKHGVPNYPDPVAGKSVPIGGVNTNSPTYQAAASACQKYQPTSGNNDKGPTSQANAQALKFAQCMRKHGVPNYPDPSSNASGGPQSVTQYGIDPNSPTFQAANSACSSLLSGGTGS